MSNEQDVTVENATVDEADNDVTVDNAVETEVEETEAQASPETDSDETEEEAPQETVDEKVVRLERENSGMQKAIDRKTAAYHSAQKAHEAKLQEIQELQVRLQQDSTKQEPNEDDFETYDKYFEAKVNYAADKKAETANAAMLEKQKAFEVQKMQAERASVLRTQETEFLTINPMYEKSKTEFSGALAALNVHPDVENAIVSTAFKGNVPQIINYFGANNGENLEQLTAIAGMSPVDAGIEMYKIQQTFVKPVKKETKTATRPIERLKRGGAPRKDLSEGDVLKNLGLK